MLGDHHLDVAVIGAGPYGLSLAAHLQKAGVSYRLFGRPMGFWRHHMPKGMLLKSDGFASNLYDPEQAFPLSRFCQERDIPYDDERIPVKLDTFVDYGLAFSNSLVSALDDSLVTNLSRHSKGFHLRSETGAEFNAKRVIIAVGIQHFTYVPPALSQLPAPLVSHSSKHRELGGFARRKIAVVGAGASAIGLAGLLRDHDCDVELICQADKLIFDENPSGRPTSFLQKLRTPSSTLGPGWKSRICTDAPLLFHMMPASVRMRIVRRHLGPAASWYVKQKIEGRVPVLGGHDVLDAAPDGSQVRLLLKGPDGQTVTRHYEHVIAGTGYRADIDRLAFIDAELRDEVACINRTPILSWDFESSVKGLSFVGPTAANSFGPMLRFACGAGFAARRVTHSLRQHKQAIMQQSRPSVETVQ